MKHKIIDALQIMLAIIITGSTAFAMQPPKKVETIKPTVAAQKPAKTLKVIEPVADKPKVGTPVVEAPKSPEIQKPDNWYKEFIYNKESRNCPTRWEGEYGDCPAFHGVPTGARQGYGLCQATPASKMAVMGSGWETSYALQDEWCTMHAQQYGGWAGAYNFWLANRWW